MVKLHHGTPLMVDHTPQADISAGDVVVCGEELRIAHADIATGRLGALAAPSGTAVYRAPKATGSGINDGNPVYWHATNKNVQATDGGGTLPRIGFAVGTTGSTATECFFRHDSAPAVGNGS